MEIKQSSITPLMILLVDSEDLKTPKTGLAPVITISKAGGGFIAPEGTVTEVGNGIYKLTPTAADTNTLGGLVLHATAAGAYAAPMLFEVVSHTRAEVMAAIAGLNNLSATGVRAELAPELARISSADSLLLVRPYVPTESPSLVIPAPDGDESLTVVYVYTENIVNVRRSGIVLAFKLATVPAKSERLLETGFQTVMTDADGFAQITLQRGLTYSVTSGDLGLANFFTPTGETFDLLTIVP